MPRWLALLLGLVVAGCDIATGLSDLQFDVSGEGGAGGRSLTGTQTVVFGERDDADVTGVTSDTFVTENTPTLNFGSAPRINVRGTPDARAVGLIRFDVGSVEPGSVVIAATLALVTEGCEGCTDNDDFTLFPMLEGWSQGIQNNDNGAASWTLAKIDVPWTTPGAGPGSHDPLVELGSVSNPPVGEEVQVELDTGVVQAWVDGDTPNHGMVVLAESDDDGAWQVVSSNGDATMRPALILELAVP